MKYAEVKIFSIRLDVFKLYEDNEYNEIYKVLSTLNNKKLKINNTLINIYKDMLENSDFERDYCSRTAEGIYKIRHDSITLMKWICYYDRTHYENINNYDLMASILTCLNEISKRQLLR